MNRDRPVVTPPPALDDERRRFVFPAPSSVRSQMKPLLLTALGSPLSDAPLGRRGDDVEVRAIPTLPLPRALDLERPTVLALDRTLVASAGEGAVLAASRARGPHRHRRDRRSRRDRARGRLSSRCARELRPRRGVDGNQARRVPRRLPPRRGAGRGAPRAQRRGRADARAGRAERDRRRAHYRARPREAAGPHPLARAARHRERRGIALPRGARRERRAGAPPIRAFAEPLAARDPVRVVRGADRLVQPRRLRGLHG